MYFPEKFYRLPLNFDHEKLLAEINTVDESHWSPHPQAFKGNDALILLSNGGTINDLNYGPMEFTPCMAQLPYLKQVLESFNTVVGRTRLMRLAPGEKVGRHSDVSLYWWHRFRIHVPIVTHPEVKFYCEDTHVHMQAGEAWTFDNWRYHEVHNNSDITRVHLVIDTVGSPELWRMLENESWNPLPGETHTPAEFQHTFVPFEPAREAHFEREQHNIIGVLSPAELDAIADFLIGDIDIAPLNNEQYQSILAHLRYIKRAWRALFSVHGRDEKYYQDYLNLLTNVVKALNLIEPKPILKSNGFILAGVLQTQVSLTIQDVINQQIKDGFAKQFPNKTLPIAKARPLKLNTSPSPKGRHALSNIATNVNQKNQNNSPIFIVSVPHGGGAFVEKLLSNSRTIKTLSDEHKQKINQSFQTHYQDNQLDDVFSKALPKEVASIISAALNTQQTNVEQVAKLIYFDNYLSVRIQSLIDQFPNAKFIYIYREPSKNLSQLKADWHEKKFLNKFASSKTGGPWHHPLPRHWQDADLNQADDYVSFQYIELNRSIMSALDGLSSESIFCVDFQDLTQNLDSFTKALCDFCKIPFGPKMQLAVSQSLEGIEKHTSEMALHTTQAPRPSEETYQEIKIWVQNLI